MNNSFKMIILMTVIGSGFVDNGQAANSKKPEEIILEKEKAALNRWINRDVWGFIDLFANDGTYFDPGSKQILKGRETIKNYLSPFNGQIYSYAYQLENVEITISNDMGILRFNYHSLNDKNEVTSSWQTTEIYRLTDHDWKVIHSHWSQIKL